jgi:hypothetical protein
MDDHDGRPSSLGGGSRQGGAAHQRELDTARHLAGRFDQGASKWSMMRTASRRLMGSVR